MHTRLRQLPTSLPITFALVFMLYGAIGTTLVLCARPNADEGFYAASAFSVSEGLVPYRDFGYTQAPLLPYLNGLLMQVTGFGVLQQRWIDLGWGAGTLVMMGYTIRRLKVPNWLFAAVLMSWVGCIAAMYFSIVGKTYPFAQFAVLATALSFFMEGSVRTRFVWLALWGTVAVATRLTVAPAVLVLWVGLVVQHGRSTPVVLAVGAPMLAGLAAFGPFLIADFGNAKFWMVDFHLGYAGPRNPFGALWESAALGPAITTLAVGALASTVARRRLATSGWLLLAGVVGWVVSVAASGAFGEYAIPLWPLVLVGAAGQLSGRVEKGSAIACFACALIVLTICGVSNPWIRQYGPWFAPGYHHAVRQASTVLREHTRSEDLIFASMPEIPLVAGRVIPLDLVMGKFNLTAEMDEATAQRYHLLTYSRLVDSVSNSIPTAVVITPSMSWSFGLTFPSFRPLPKEVFDSFVTPLKRNYTVVYWDAYYAIFVRRPTSKSPSPSLESVEPH